MAPLIYLEYNCIEVGLVLISQNFEYNSCAASKSQQQGELLELKNTLMVL